MGSPVGYIPPLYYPFCRTLPRKWAVWHRQDTCYDMYTFGVPVPDVNKDSQWHGQWRPSDKNRSLESAVFVFRLCEVGVLLCPQPITEPAIGEDDIVIRKRRVACDIPLQDTALSKAHREEVLLPYDI